MSTNGCSGFFLFCLDLKLLAKIENDLVSTHSQKPVFLITQDLKEIKKNLEHAFVVGARQSFQFFRQTTWFLNYGILHYLISIIK